MAKQFPCITDAHADFMARQKLFLVASAAHGSRVNISPRSTDSFRLLGPGAVAYLDRTGSGNETAAHARAGGGTTIMFCAFEGAPLILRLYGKARVHHRASNVFARLLGEHFGGISPAGTRQIVQLDVELVQTSCGYGIPRFDYAGERASLDRWAEAKGKDGIEAYWREKSVRSIDGLPTGLFEADGSEAALAGY